MGTKTSAAERRMARAEKAKARRMRLALAQDSLNRGAWFPYDATDAWLERDGENPPPANDWAHRAARGCIAELADRRGISRALEEVDEGVRIQIIGALADWAHYAAMGVIAGLASRNGICQALEHVDQPGRAEIVIELAEIIRQARKW